MAATELNNVQIVDVLEKQLLEVQNLLASPSEIDTRGLSATEVERLEEKRVLLEGLITIYHAV